MLVVLGLAAVGVYMVSDALALAPGRRPPELWEIPGGYKGLIVARFGVPECAPIQRRDGKHVYVVRADGTFCTSSRLPEGTATDAYEYVYADGRRVALRYADEVAKLIVRGRPEPDPGADLFIFVGTPEEQRRAHDTLPRS